MRGGKIETMEDAVALQRAFRAGAHWAFAVCGEQHLRTTAAGTLNREIEEKFPVPTKQEPAVLDDPEHPIFSWRVLAGQLQVRAHEGEWRDYTASDVPGLIPTQRRCATWATLFAQPTVTVVVRE